MEKSVFISRETGQDSPFRQILEAQNWRVTGFPLINFTPIPLPTAPPEADWIFFSSSQAVRFFFKAYPNAPLSQFRWAALGPGTASVLNSQIPLVDFIGNGDPQNASNSFFEVCKNTTVLFPEALNGRHSVQKFLGEKISAVSLPVYENHPMPNPPELIQSVLVFTSPMNARAYFNTHPLRKTQYVVAIGRTTAQQLKELGILKIHTAAQPSESELAKTIVQIESARD